MTFSSGSRHSVQYVPEVTFGTTPAVPQTTQVAVASINITPSKDIFSDPSIRSDRSIRFNRHGNVHVAGDIETAYQLATYDDFLANAFHGAWTTNVLKQGVLRNSMTIERGYLDMDVPSYQVFNGMVINQFKLDVPVNDVVKSTYSLMGMGQANSSTSLDSTPTIPADQAPMTHLSGSFLEGGSAVGNMTAITLTIGNGYTENFVLGAGSPANLSYGYAQVNGQLTVYFDSFAQYNKFINETETTLSFSINNGLGGSHTYVLPRVKFNNMSVPVVNDQAIVATIPFTALYDSVSGTAVQVTRSA